LQPKRIRWGRRDSAPRPRPGNSVPQAALSVSCGNQGRNSRDPNKQEQAAWLLADSERGDSPPPQRFVATISSVVVRTDVINLLLPLRVWSCEVKASVTEPSSSANTTHFFAALGGLANRSTRRILVPDRLASCFPLKVFALDRYMLTAHSKKVKADNEAQLVSELSTSRFLKSFQKA